MISLTTRQLIWAGGTGAVKPLGKNLRPAGSAMINIKKDIVARALPAEARLLAPDGHKFSKWNRKLRTDIYDELLKLPLRYTMHPYERLVHHSRQSDVGYAPPMGPAERDDVIPFFVHRDAGGHLPGKLYSMNTKIMMPHFFLAIQRVEGDLWRFEDELIKIFPTKKTFVRGHSVFVFGADADARMVLHHWLLGLGF